MAPELFDRRSPPSKESDIYALGMVIYEVCCIAFPSGSILTNHFHRSSHKSAHSLTYPTTPHLGWSSPESDPRDQRTGRFSACRRISGCWRKGAGTWSWASGPAFQTLWSSLRRRLVVGFHRLPKRSRISISAVQPTKTLPRQNRPTRCQRLCLDLPEMVLWALGEPGYRHWRPTERRGLSLSNIDAPPSRPHV